jgi:hypothetical protein
MQVYVVPSTHEPLLDVSVDDFNADILEKVNGK